MKIGSAKINDLDKVLEGKKTIKSYLITSGPRRRAKIPERVIYILRNLTVIYIEE